jgi:hypothetical protein
MRSSGYYWAFWLLTRPLVWIASVVLRAIKWFFMYGATPSGGLHYRPLSGSAIGIRLLVAAGFSVTMTSMIVDGSLNPGLVRPRDNTQWQGVLSPGALFVGFFVLLLVYTLLENHKWVGDVLLPVAGLAIAGFQVVLIAGSEWLIFAGFITFLFFLVLRLLSTNIRVVWKIGVLTAVFVFLQSVASVAG